MTRTLRGFAASTILSMLIFAPMIWAADHAAAATTVIEFTGEDFYIPRPADRTDQENVERLLASVDVPAELVGLTCSVAGTSANGESVHPNNYGVLRSNGDSVTISGTEDTANGVRLSDRVIVLGDTVRLYNVMVPDPDGIVATSVAYTVRVTCEPTETTTTSTPTESTSSTLPPSSTTSMPTTTTTDSPTSSSTTTPPTSSSTAPDTSTTTQPPTTSTTAPDGSTSTTAPTVSTSSIPPVTRPTLPFTGPDREDLPGIAMAATALLMLGGGIVLAARSN